MLSEYLDMIYKWMISSGAKVLAIVIGSFILIRVIKIMIRRSKLRFAPMTEGDIEKQKRAETLSDLIEKTARIVILVAALLMVLQAVGIDIAPLLAGAGVVGLAVGFGAQDLVKDVISGFFILLENHFNMGDVVSISGEAGLVESINLRFTRLRDLGGNVHIIPNGEITTITNMTKEYSNALFEIGVAYKENVDDVIAIIHETAAGMREDSEYGPKIIGDLEMFGLDSFGDSSVNIKFRMRTLPIQQWSVMREFNRRIKNVFDERNIEIPFPHVTLYMGEGENTGFLRVETSKQEE